MAIKAIVIDDEVMARNLLKGMLEEFCKEVEVVEMCKDLPSGILAIRKLQPDIVFLDIEMPGYSGLEILNFFSDDEMTFSIIFTTSYNEYAIQALKLSAIDYLLKPIEPDDLISSINLYHKKMFSSNFQMLRENLQSPVVKKIPIYTVTSIIFVQLDDILFMKAEGAYTKIYFTDGNSIMASKGLKHFEDLVSTERSFMRTHKSFIANINYVDEYVKSNGGYLVIRDYEVGLSSDKVNQLMDLLRLGK